MSADTNNRRGRLLRVFQIVWTTVFILAGAMVGWSNHGLVGALALAVVGAIAGGVLSQPLILLQILR